MSTFIPQNVAGSLESSGKSGVGGVRSNNFLNSAPAIRVRSRSWPAFLVLATGLALLAWAAVHRWSTRGVDPQSLWEQAESALAAGELDRADAILVRLAQRRPATLADRLLRAEVARRRGRLERALAALDGVADTDPGAALIWRTRGMLELERDRAKAAEDALRRAVALDPKQLEARRDLVSLYTILSRHRELAHELHGLASITPLGFDDLYLWCLDRRPDVGPAERAVKLKRMLSNDTANPSIRLALAETLRELGRVDESEQVLAPLSDDDPEVRAARTRLAFDRGRGDTAARLLAAGPADHPALEALRGRLALAEGSASAIKHFRAVLAALPDDRDALFGLGQSLRLAGEPAAAAPFFEGARRRDHLKWLIENARSPSLREDAQVLRAIGDSCRSLNRLPEARAWYKLALTRDPLDPALQKSLFQLGNAQAHDKTADQRIAPSSAARPGTPPRTTPPGDAKSLR
jgi:tetratricopeptide (TPR) repeat protein